MSKLKDLATAAYLLVRAEEEQKRSEDQADIPDIDVVAFVERLQTMALDALKTAARAYVRETRSLGCSHGYTKPSDGELPCPNCPPEDRDSV